MQIRPAVPADEQLLAAICTRAFFDDDLFGRVIHPQRNEFPKDVQIYWHEALRQNWRSPRCRILVVVERSGVEQVERIVAMAIWERQGDDADGKKVVDDCIAPDPWPSTVPRWNRALDPTKKTILQDAKPFSNHYWRGPCAINWHLILCCVDPNHQKKGYGRLLTNWGLERAKEEGIRASVIASHGCSGFYLKCGFKEIVGDASQAGGVANPMMKANVKGGDILFSWVEG